MRLDAFLLMSLEVHRLYIPISRHPLLPSRLGTCFHLGPAANAITKTMHHGLQTSVQWEYVWLKAMLVVLKPSLKLVQ